VRLRYAYFITCREVIKNAAGEVIELRCTYDPATRGGNAPDGRKVQATLHWVSAADSVPAELRLYNPLFTRPDRARRSFAADLNPNSLEVLTESRLEPSTGGCHSRRAGAVRAAGLFLARSRGDAGPAHLQPHGRAARYLGQGGRREGRLIGGQRKRPIRLFAGIP